MKESRFLALLSKKLQGEVSTEENQLLERQLAENQNHKKLSDGLGEYFATGPRRVSQAKQRLSQAWKKIDDPDEAFNGKYDFHATSASPVRLFLKIAALVVILLTAGTLSYYASHRNSDVQFSTLTSAGNKIFTTLDDGTRVWLNINSSIRYNEGFGKDNREMFLKGEAFFDVVKNTKIPLVIHARNVDITVKGTAFNVNSYSALPGAEVLLIRGSVEVRNRLNSTQAVTLKASEKLITSEHPTDEAGMFRIVNTSETVQLHASKWTNDSIVFKKEKMKDLAVQLEKKYSVKIEIRDERLKDRRFSGVFTGESIAQALEALKLSYPFSYTMSEKLIVIDK